MNQQAIKYIKAIKMAGYNAANYERCLKLPFGSLEKWKKRCPKDALALLRITAHLPWIIEVAEYQFHPTFALGAQIVAANKLVKF